MMHSYLIAVNTDPKFLLFFFPLCKAVWFLPWHRPHWIWCGINCWWMKLLWGCVSDTYCCFMVIGLFVWWWWWHNIFHYYLRLKYGSRAIYLWPTVITRKYSLNSKCVFSTSSLMLENILWAGILCSCDLCYEICAWLTGFP